MRRLRSTRRNRWSGLLALSLTLLVAAPVAVSAAGTAPGDEVSSGSPRVDASLRKLGRGIANVASCPFEFLRVPYFVTLKEGYVAGSTVGLLKGVWMTLVRGVTGVYEVVTFPVEVPEGYAPLLQPEFIWKGGRWVE